MADFAIGLDGKPLFNESELNAAVNLALDESAEIVVDDYDEHQKTWSSKSKSPPITTVGRWFRRIEVKGTIFRVVDWGRKARTIVPKKAKVLKFKSDYKRKTAPRRIPSGQGGAFGKDVFAKEVRQKASTPSLVTETIVKKINDESPPIFDEFIEVALDG